MRWLTGIAHETQKGPIDGIRRVANEIINEIPQIRQGQRLGDLEGALGRLAKNIRSGTDNIDFDDVDALLTANMLSEIMDAARDPGATDVKRRQIAVALVRNSRHGEAAAIASYIQNRAERRTIGLETLASMPRGAGVDSEEWKLLVTLHPLLREPQRRDLVEKMEELGIAPVGLYAQV